MENQRFDCSWMAVCVLQAEMGLITLVNFAVLTKAQFKKLITMLCEGSIAVVHRLSTTTSIL